MNDSVRVSTGERVSERLKDLKHLERLNTFASLLDRRKRMLEVATIQKLHHQEMRTVGGPSLIEDADGGSANQ